MNSEPQLCFPPFRLDLVNEQLWRERQEIPLRQKTFAVLRYLVEHPDQLVTKEALLDAVWAGTTVSDVAPGVCVQELRRALGEDRQTPRFIVTVHRRGYRFIAPLTTASPVSSFKFQVSSSLSTPVPSTQHPAPTLVGREAELSQLHGWLDKALNGERQLVFVTGEPGIGKTTVVEAFLEQVATEGSLWIGRGQCIEHYGAGEGYMPVLEALGRLCREPSGSHFLELLAQQAPTWLVQMPALLSRTALEALQRKTAGATRERMLREMAEALEALTAERPLVLRLEDLHWSDYSTLELLSVLARRREAARLLVMGTYRPVEMLADGHPLRTVKQELLVHRQCVELPLRLLSEGHVAEYLARRFEVGAHGQWKSQAEAVPLQELVRTVHQRTEGNPLFMVNVVDYLAAQGGLGESAEKVQVGIPGNLRQMIEEQIHRLSSAERRVLEVASIAGAEFSAAAVAAGAEAALGEVEEQCAGLVRREHFLRTRGTEEWPDGTVAARYGFLHALYQDVLYERVTAGQCIELHRRIGEREEQAYGERAREIAVALAVHFERGRDYRRAIHYLQQAGENALRRSAHQEAIQLVTRGLELLKTWPEAPERTQHELTLQIALGAPLMAVKGYAAPEVEKAYNRALALCRQAGETPQLFPVLWGLWAFYHIRGELQTARELAEQFLSLAQSVQDPAPLLEAHYMLGETLYFLGELVPARAHLEQGVVLYDPQKHYHVQDPGVGCLFDAALDL